MPAASIRSQVGTQTTAAATSAALTRAPTVVLGDVLVLQIGYTGALGVIAPPAGWTLWFAVTSSSVCSEAWYWRVVRSADLAAATYAFGWATATVVAANCYCLMNCDDDPSTWPRVQTIGNSTAPTPTAVLAQQPNCRLLHGVTTVTVSDVTPPAGYTELLDTTSTTGTPNQVRVQTASLVQAADGTTGAVAASIATAQAWVAAMIVVPSADYPMERAPATTGSTTTVTANVTVPAGTLTGDLRVVEVRVPNQTATVGTPAGWTSIGAQPSAATGAFRVYYFRKLAGGQAGMPTSDATQAFTLSAAATTTWWRSSAIKRVHQTTPTGAAVLNANAATATTYAHPGATTTTANSLVILFSAKSTTTGTATPPTNYTERNDTAAIGEVADRVQAAAGATGTLTVTWSATAFGVGLALEVLYAPAVGVVGPTWRSSVATAGGSTSLVLTKAAGTVEDDLMLHDISIAADAGAVTAAPSGWTAIGAIAVTNSLATPDHVLVRYAKVAGPSEPASYTYTTNNAGTQAGSHSFAGCPLGLSHIGQASTASGQSTSPLAPSITTSNPNALALYLTTTFTAAATAAGPAGMTLGLQAQNQQLFWQRIAAAGATGTRGQTITSDFWTAALLELIGPAAAAGPTAAPRQRRDHLRRR